VWWGECRKDDVSSAHAPTVQRGEESGMSNALEVLGRRLGAEVRIQGLL
jgi:hypothetical protein